MKFKPGELGYELEHDSSVSFDEARRNALRLARRTALKTIDYALWNGEDIFEPIDNVEAERGLNYSGVSTGINFDAHARYELSDMNPEEQVYHDYHGDAPQDP